MKKEPKEWQKVKDDWSETFAGVNYNVKVDVEIVDSGLTKGPFEPKE
ncbi:Ger(x)C family spore germination C-terminal domain-containing protein [Halobacillus andaensis]